MSRDRRDALLTFAVALAARLAVVAWAWQRIPPAADGTYYERIAERIAQGLGYTWLWPDGVVTYAAHYPVGYPAFVGAVYAVTGPHPVAAMTLNAVLGALAALAAHRLAARCMGPRRALLAGMLVALHPGLVAYTPALMTEGVTAALVTAAAAVAAWARDRRAAAAIPVGLVVGIATLVRPQCIVLAPLFGLLAAVPTKSSARRASAMVLGASLAALCVCAPWTARNCVRMKRCALVSVNGGWNLLIGADAASTGAWSPIKVPEACREVFDEAAKDVCFGDEARRFIREHPAAWLGLAPKKLAATFDYAGAGPWYLHEANPEAFPWRAKKTLGALETIYERLVLLAALVWALGRVAPEESVALRRVRVVLAVLAGASVFTLHAWMAYLALATMALMRGRHLWLGPVLPAAAIVVLLTTAATHAAFFGAGRYALVVFPLLTALAPLAGSKPSEDGPATSA
jgi:4-amino-4-deoxy-L-arabinose transferase-like glycosyltransferase